MRVAHRRVEVEISEVASAEMRVSRDDVAEFNARRGLNQLQGFEVVEYVCGCCGGGDSRRPIMH